MKKKTGVYKESYQKWVWRMVKMMRKNMYLSEWSYSVKFSKGEHKKEKINDGFSVAGTNSVSVKYLEYEITLYPLTKKYFDKSNYSAALEVIIHELCHVYTEPLYEAAIKEVGTSSEDFIETLREQTTQRISSAILGLIPRKDYIPLTKKK